MGIIKKLDTITSNQIAAGEVVERPASVVKELVENSIDAGATSITVRIERGGISRIQITDDGCGMMREDAENCFARHATSKISTAADLQSIYTMGFRGEALASISSIAQVDLYTKREQDETGVHIVALDGEVQSCVEEGMPNGTTFVVANIFYNVPARMKFLKSDKTEGSYITDLMERFILSHPEISFRYISNRKEIYFSSGDGNLINCIYTVYGKDYSKNVLPVNYKHEYVTVSGFVGKSELARPNRLYQSIFVNKRYVKNDKISRTISDAYKNQIMVNKFPMAVLNIDIDASMVDINVHPSKQEIKFSNDNDIMTAVFRGVENALHSDYSIPKVEIKKKPSEFKADVVKADAQYELQWEKNKDRWSPAEEKPQYPKKTNEEEKIKNFKDTYKTDISDDYFEQRRREVLKETLHTKAVMDVPVLKEDMPKPKDFVYPESNTPFADTIFKKETQKIEVKEPEIVKEPTKEIVKETQNIIAGENFRVVGQVFSTYVIVEKDNEMLIIDQHAAHERLKFEEIKEELDKKAVSAQDLLVPVTVNLSPIEYTLFIENAEFLEELGFEGDDFGTNSIIIRTAPAYVDYDDIQELLIELLEQIGKNRGKPVSQKAEYAVYTIACKAAVKANHRLDEKELEALVKKVFTLGSVNTCPHGRPITVSMTKKELEKEFKRIL